MGESKELTRILGHAWPQVLDQMREAVIVMDHQRTLRFVNEHARRLLGYGEDEVLGTRCRLTTRGVDCECACPLTFALEHQLSEVRDFTAVYHTKEGQPVHLSVTILPLRDEEGELLGAVEVLRPTVPTVGFVLAGASELALALRRRAAELATSEAPVLLMGEEPACADLARSIHRLGGLGDELFHLQRDGSPAPGGWPPGSVYVDVGGADDLTAIVAPESWRLLVGARSRPSAVPADWEEVELPPLSQRSTDLPLMVARWVDELSPGTTVAPAASARLCQLAVEVGFTRLAETLAVAAAAAGDELGEEHLPEHVGDGGLVDSVLGSANPLESLEARILLEVLERHGWRMQEAADRLGMSRVTLWRKLREHGIQRPTVEEGGGPRRPEPTR